MIKFAFKIHVTKNCYTVSIFLVRCRSVQFIFQDKIRYNADFSKKFRTPVNSRLHYADFSKKIPHSSEFYTAL